MFGLGLSLSPFTVGAAGGKSAQGEDFRQDRGFECKDTVSGPGHSFLEVAVGR